MLVHILQHVFHPNLLGIAHRPHRIELQPLGNRAFQYKYRSCPGTGYQIDTLRMQVRYRLAEHTVMPRVHQPDAVGTYQGSAVLIYRFQNTVFQKRTLMCLLSKSGRKNDERPHLLFGSQYLHCIRAHHCRYGKDRQVRIRNIFYIGISGNSLHLRLFGIDGTQFSRISTTNQISQDSTSRFMYIIGCPHHHNTGRMQQLVCYHNLFCQVHYI